MSDEAPISARNAIFGCNACLRAHITRHVDSTCTYVLALDGLRLCGCFTDRDLQGRGSDETLHPRREAVSYAGYPGRSTSSIARKAMN